ncbi:Nse4 C-terminal-domain-containing protein [Xylariales sp. AK1849]|nr:Nse4 C-terminal-domain-containing protein [Xylariales sp. AK1849]
MSSSPPSPDSPARWSDKENTPRRLAVRNKRSQGPEGAKRKRALTNGVERGSSRRRARDPSEEASDDEDQYNPDQPIEERRIVQRGLRDLMKNLSDNNDEYLQPESDGLQQILRRANSHFRGVKQTTEATIDSRLLVKTVENAYQKTVRLTAGNVALGLDADEFISKCITYMRLGAGIANDDAQELSSTQRQRRQPHRRNLREAGDEDEDEIGDDGDMCNWEHLGKFACLPHIRRPATPGFLLGPLSVEKKVRKITKRSAPFRPNNLKEVRPEVLEVKDIQKNEENDLGAICTKILDRLEAYQNEAQETAEAVHNQGDDDETTRVMQEYGLRTTGGIDYFKFVMNPKSFGQTIENMFYVSFLIRDAKLRLEFDVDGLPTLSPVDASEREGGAVRHTQKQQAIFHLDPAQHRDIIDAFDITESIIEHRKEQNHAGPGARGWYN